MSVKLQPPIKKGLPLVGNIPEIRKDPLKFFQDLANSIPNLAQYKLLYRRNYLVSGVASIRHILVGRPKNYKKSTFYEPLALLLGKGLLTNEGDFWLKQRRLAQPAFHRDKITGFAKTMIQVAQDKIKTLNALADNHQAFDLHKLMTGVAFAVVDKTLLAQKETGDEEKIYQAFTPALKFVSHRQFTPFRWPINLPFPSYIAFRKNRDTLNHIIDQVIEQKKAEGAVGSDLVSMLLQAKDEDTGEGMSEAQLKDEIMTIFLAGFETTANALSWTFYLLATHPDIREKLLGELESVLGSREVQAEDFNQLAYTQRVISESLRIYPPAWVVGREALDEDEIDGYFIPKGSTLTMSIYSLHHHPAIWKNPEAFEPDRFLPEVFTEVQKQAYLPFGGGPRFCIGNNFAIMEMTLVLATLVPKFKFSVDPQHQVAMEAGVTLKPKDGLWMTVEKA